MRRSSSIHLISLVILAVICAAAIFFFSKYINHVEPVIPEDTAETETTADTTADEEKEIRIWDDPEDSEDTENEDAASSSPYVLKSSGDAGEEYLSNIVFIGDSTINEMKSFDFTGLLPDPTQQIWSVDENVSVSKISSVNNFVYPSTGEAMNYESALKDRTPRFVILTFGSFSDEIVTKDSFISAYGSYIAKIKEASRNTAIMIQSILPVSENCSVISPESVAERNEWLIELCEAYQVYYIDTWSEMVDENGYLYNRFAGPNGYTLNEEGYLQMVGYIRYHSHPSYVINND